MAIEITDVNFDEIVLKSNKPVLIDFWAEWCNPCKKMIPIIEELSIEYKETIIIGKMDVDNNPKSSSKLGIRNIPAMIFFKNGEIVDKQIGATTKSILIEKLDNQLKG